MALSQSLNKVLAQAENLASVLQRIDQSLDGGRGVGGGAAGSGGGGGVMSGALANVPGGGGSGIVGAGFNAARGAFGNIPGVNEALDVVGGATNIMFNSVPGLDQNIARQAREYGAAVRVGSDMTSQRIRMAGFSFRETGGMQYAGQDAVLAQQLAVYGVDPTGRFGQQTLTAAGNASALLNINAETAAASIANLSSGAGSANLMRQLGVYTSDPSTGEQLSPQQITQQIISRLYTGRAPLTEESVNASFYRGQLGASLRGLGLDPAMQEMIRSQLIAQAGGKTLDLTSTQSTQAFAGGLAAGENPNLAYNRMAEADTRTMDATANTMTAALNDAAGAAENFASVVRWALQNIPGAQQILQVGAFDSALQASKSGQGTSQAISTAISGVGNAVGALVGSGLKAIGIGDDNNRNATGATTVSAKAAAKSDQASSWAMPAPGSVSSGFGVRTHPISGQKKMHNGTDIAAPMGAPVTAIGDGVVIKVGDSGSTGYGKYVRIDHQNGYRSLYAHMSQTLVANGAKVKKGQLIGKVGSTGSSTGPHLHIEVTKDGALVDPMGVLSGAGVPDVGASAEANAKQNTTENGLPSISKISGSGLLPVNQDLQSLAQEFIATEPMIAFERRVDRRAAGDNDSRLALGPRTGSRRGPSTYMPGMPRAKQGDPYVAQDGPVNVHAGEAILTADQAQEWRDQQRGVGRRGGGANVTIKVYVQQASETEARRLAGMVKEYIHEDELMARMGSS